MKEKMKETFNPVYNNAEQVKECVSFLGEPIKDARIALVIGHNGLNFVSSTDWRLVTESGIRRIFTFSARPQYPNFLECVAGVSYSGQQGQFTVLPDKENPRGAVVVMEGKRYSFEPGEALKIYVDPREKFIATDCMVICEDDGIHPRVYRIITDEDTLYGRFDEKGRICQV